MNLISISCGSSNLRTAVQKRYNLTANPLQMSLGSREAMNGSHDNTAPISSEERLNESDVRIRAEEALRDSEAQLRSLNEELEERAVHVLPPAIQPCGSG